MNIFRIWRGMLLTPTQTFEEELSTSSSQKIGMALLAAVLCWIGAAALSYYLASTAVVALFIQIGLSLLGFVSGVVLTFVSMKILGGQGTFGQTSYLCALFTSLGAVFQIVLVLILLGTGSQVSLETLSPVLGMIVANVSVVLLVSMIVVGVKGMKALGGFTTLRAIATFIVEGILTFVLFFAIILSVGWGFLAAFM